MHPSCANSCSTSCNGGPLFRLPCASDAELLVAGVAAGLCSYLCERGGGEEEWVLRREWWFFFVFCVFCCLCLTVPLGSACAWCAHIAFCDCVTASVVLVVLFF